MILLFSFINIQKYSFKLPGFLATIFVKMNTFGGENKHFDSLKITAEVFSSTVPPQWILSLFILKRKNKSSTEVSFLNFMLVAMAGRKVTFGGKLDACFSFWEKLY